MQRNDGQRTEDRGTATARRLHSLLLLSLWPAFRWFLLGQGFLHKGFPIALEFQSVRLGAGSRFFLRMVRVVRHLFSVHEF